MNVYACKVFFEDTDAAQIVYHANYLKFCDRARTEWLRSMGVDFDRLLREVGTTFVVADVTMKFVQPARLGDVLEVHSAVESAGFSEVVFHQSVRRHDGEERLCDVRVRCAYVAGADYKPIRMPRDLRELLKHEVHAR